MSCHSRAGHRGAVQAARAEAAARLEKPVDTPVVERHLHALLSEARSLPVRTPDADQFTRWIEDREFAVSLYAENGRTRDAALENLAQVRQEYAVNPDSVDGVAWHAWQHLVDYTTYHENRTVLADPLRVAFDCDGVLYEFNDVLREWLSGRGWDRSRMPTPEVYSLRDAWGISTETLIEEMSLAVQGGVLWHTGVPLDATKAARSLGEAGHHIVVSTARRLSGLEDEAYAATIGWLRTHGVHPDTLFLADPVLSAEDKLRCEYDVLFDDNPENVEVALANGRTAFLVDQPWNQDVSGFPRIAMDDIAGHVAGMSDERAATASASASA